MAFRSRRSQPLASLTAGRRARFQPRASIADELRASSGEPLSRSVPLLPAEGRLTRAAAKGQERNVTREKTGGRLDSLVGMRRRFLGWFSDGNVTVSGFLYYVSFSPIRASSHSSLLACATSVSRVMSFF